MKTSQKINKLNYFKSLSLFASMILINGCAGQSSNPLDKYKDMKIAAPSDQKIEKQTIPLSDLFQLSTPDSASVSTIHFIEGQNNEVLLKVSTKSNKILKYSIEFSDFTTAERPQLKATSTDNVYALVWNPPVGTIPQGDFTLFKAKIILTVAEASAQSLISLSQTKEIEVIVSRNNSQPVILDKSIHSQGIDEGIPSEFSVIVEDSAANSANEIPEVQIKRYVYSNTEAFRADISNFVVPVTPTKDQPNPEILGAHKFRFHYKILVDRLPLDKDREGRDIPNAPQLDACFLVQAFGVVGVKSAQSQVCTVARYMVQPPKISLVESEFAEVKSAVPSVFHIKFSAEHSLASVSVTNGLGQLANLPGTKEITCDSTTPDKKNEILCTLKFTPACQKVELTKTINLKADNLLNKKIKSSVFTKEIKIIPNPEACTVATPIKPAVKPAAKPATKPVTPKPATPNKGGQ